MNRSQIGQGQPKVSASPKPVEKHNVKLCALCGTLNLESNAECWTCRWHGEFSHDAPMIELAWLRLESLYEEVRLEHVTSRKIRTLGDFGTVQPPTGWQGFRQAISDWWQSFQTQRDLRMAQRQASLRSRLPSRPNQLGV